MIALPPPKPPYSVAWMGAEEARLHFVKWRIACGAYTDLVDGKPEMILPIPKWTDRGLREEIECAG